MKTERWVTSNLCEIRGMIRGEVERSDDRIFFQLETRDPDGHMVLIPCRADYETAKFQLMMDGVWVLANGTILADSSDGSSGHWLEVFGASTLPEEEREFTNLALFTGREVRRFEVICLADIEHPKGMIRFKVPNMIGKGSCEIMGDVSKELLPKYKEYCSRERMQLIGTLRFSRRYTRENRQEDIADITVTGICSPEDISGNRKLKRNENILSI